MEKLIEKNLKIEKTNTLYNKALKYYEPYINDAIKQYKKYTREEVSKVALENILSNRNKNRDIDKMAKELKYLVEQHLPKNIQASDLERSIYDILVYYNNDVYKSYKGNIFGKDVNDYIKENFQIQQGDRVLNFEVLNGNKKESYENINPGVLNLLKEVIGNKPDGLFILEDGCFIPIYSQISLWNRDIHKFKSLTYNGQSIFNEMIFEGMVIKPLFVIAEPFTFNKKLDYESRVVVEGYLNENIVYKDMITNSIMNILNMDNLYKIK